VDQAVAEGVVEAAGGLRDVAARPAEVHRAELLDDFEEVRAVHVVHDDEVQVPVLVDVVGADDVRVFEAAGRPRLAVEPPERRRLFRLRRGQNFDRHPPLHEHVLAQEHLPHAADPDPLQELELADREPAPLAQQELFRLEVREDAVVHHLVGEVAWVGRHAAAELPPLHVRRQLRLVDHPALADELNEFFDRGGCGHRSPGAGVEGRRAATHATAWEFLSNPRTPSRGTQTGELSVVSCQLSAIQSVKLTLFRHPVRPES
jgi:hypothetical protein